jgi:ubiquitin C-terminal hydrolase
MNINERERIQDEPSGLKNIGNTCYFSSLMQVLFHLPNIQEKFLNLNIDDL